VYHWASIKNCGAKNDMVFDIKKVDCPACLEAKLKFKSWFDNADTDKEITNKIKKLNNTEEK
jgi:hypothetical protein